MPWYYGAIHSRIWTDRKNHKWKNVDFSVQLWNEASIHELENLCIVKEQKARMSNSKLKIMLMFFILRMSSWLSGTLGPNGTYLVGGGGDWAPWAARYQTVSILYWGLIKGEKVRKKRLDLWKKNSCILHHDNAPAHYMLSVKHFVTFLQHASHSPDLAPYDFFMLPKLKCELKRTHVQSSKWG